MGVVWRKLDMSCFKIGRSRDALIPTWQLDKQQELFHQVLEVDESSTGEAENASATERERSRSMPLPAPKRLPSAEPRPPCRTHTSHKNCWTTSSTTYTTQKTRSGTVASSQNRGSRVPECTFSPTSGSTCRSTCDRGKTSFQTLPPLLRITQELCSFDGPGPLALRMQRRIAGFRPFRALSA
jgi:hypothetical protein